MTNLQLSYCKSNLGLRTTESTTKLRPEVEYLIVLLKKSDVSPCV